ncbi:MAG: hypothetical protein WC378_10085 [Opitutaceae bacterium]
MLLHLGDRYGYTSRYLRMQSLIEAKSGTGRQPHIFGIDGKTYPFRLHCPRAHLWRVADRAKFPLPVLLHPLKVIQ